MILSGFRLSKYSFLEREPLELEYGVFGIVQTKKEKFLPHLRLGITLGVAGIILGVIPLVVACVSGAAQGTTLFWVAFLLLCVACAVADIVFVSIVRGSHQKLLEEGGKAWAIA